MSDVINRKHESPSSLSPGSARPNNAADNAALGGPLATVAIPPASAYTRTTGVEMQSLAIRRVILTNSAPEVVRGEQVSEQPAQAAHAQTMQH
ncbi:hypothetical protein LTR85_001810 [Meristemomyces frigidus]|nr:hypothetical protein LTR85_001810 [Meristemomyces frigidus]